MITLRRPRPADAAGVFSVHGDPRTYAHDPAETHRRVEDSAEFLGSLDHHWRRHGFGYWTVLVPRDWWPDGVADPLDDDQDDDLVHAGLGGIQHHAVNGEPVLNVYYRFGIPVHGRGIATHVVGQAKALAPTVAPGLDLVVRTRPANAAARRVAERAGFRDLGPSPWEDDMQLLRLAVDRPAGAI
jgi:ribosomal-protein-alanine N-acetyltransferase